jgi:hypothetical protein
MGLNWLTLGRSVKLLLALAITVILGSLWC